MHSSFNQARLHVFILAASLIGASNLAVAHGDERKGTSAMPMQHGQTAMHREQTNWGIAADAKASKAPTRSITVEMLDGMRFKPDTLAIKRGETVRLIIKNSGQLKHEFVIGTPKALQEHAAMMLKFPNMEHAEAHMAHVDPGKSGEILWTFNRAGEFEFACLLPGHFQAGMLGKISVKP